MPKKRDPVAQTEAARRLLCRARNIFLATGHTIPDEKLSPSSRFQEVSDEDRETYWRPMSAAIMRVAPA